MSERFTIEHSGFTWVSLGRGPAGNHIWPIDEYLVRSRHKRTVQERIRKMNPCGKEEGSVVRGLFSEPKSWRWAKKKLQRGESIRRDFRRKGGKGEIGIWRYWQRGPAGGEI